MATRYLLIDETSKQRGFYFICKTTIARLAITIVKSTALLIIVMFRAGWVNRETGAAPGVFASPQAKTL